MKNLRFAVAGDHVAGDDLVVVVVGDSFCVLVVDSVDCDNAASFCFNFKAVGGIAASDSDQTKKKKREWIAARVLCHSAYVILNIDKRV